MTRQCRVQGCFVSEQNCFGGMRCRALSMFGAPLPRCVPERGLIRRTITGSSARTAVPRSGARSMAMGCLVAHLFEVSLAAGQTSPAPDDPNGSRPLVVATPAPTSELPSATEPPSSEPVSTAADAELALARAALQGEVSGGGLVDPNIGGPPHMSLYGFADFTYMTQLGERSPLGPIASTFAVGNLNIYLASEISQSWRSVIEVRLLYLPHGSLASEEAFDPGATRANNDVNDHADLTHEVRWGGIEIQRAQIEHDITPWLTLRAGQWLSPYGIWNVDHGSPTVLMTTRPYIIGEALIPERQTGLQAFGSVFIDATKLGYHLTLSNGRGPIDAYRDLDNNKAVGGRLFVSNDSLLGDLTIGASFYRGTYTDRPAQSLTTNAAEQLVFDDRLTLRYEELALGLDVRWEWQNFLLQGEALRNDLAYDDAIRPADDGDEGAPPGFVADVRIQGFYALIAYRTPFWNASPYVQYQLFSDDLVTTNAWVGGVNVRPLPVVVVKLETMIIDSGGFFPTMYMLSSQIAWSF
jgi:hypothetical protein